MKAIGKFFGSTSSSSSTKVINNFPTKETPEVLEELDVEVMEFQRIDSKTGDWIVSHYSSF